MKTIIALSLAGALGLGVYLFLTLENEVKYETKTHTETVEVDALEKLIDEAIAASSTDIEARAQEAYEDAKHQAEVEIELAITSQYQTKVTARVEALQKESIVY